MGLLIARGPLENPDYLAGMIGGISVTAVLVSRLGFIGDESQQNGPVAASEASHRSGGLDQQLEDAGREVGHPQRDAVALADQFDKFRDVAFVILAEADQSVSQVAVAQGRDRQRIGPHGVIVELEQVVQLGEERRVAHTRGMKERQRRPIVGEGGDCAGHVVRLIQGILEI
jgi:hypothetical protein